MKQVTILSGKGGTGKTTVTGSFATLSENIVLADCDVDASNLHLLLRPRVQQTMEFKGLKLAYIDPNDCTKCGLCEKYCRFNAIEQYAVEPIQCEGCGVCLEVCPINAIVFKDRVCGYAYISSTKYGPMSHARLTPGMENNGKLVTLVRQNAKKLAEQHKSKLVLMDGPPGLGCPVIASLSESDASVLVVEPTLSGIHDLTRVLELLEHFKIMPLVLINKVDINQENSKKIQDYCTEQNVRVIGKIPFDENVTKAMVNGVPVIEYLPDSPSSIAIKDAWMHLRELLQL